MDNDVILELRDVSKIYESVNALSNINLKVKKGDWIAIIGFWKDYNDEYNRMYG